MTKNRSTAGDDLPELLTIEDLERLYPSLTARSIYAARHRGNGPRAVKLGKRLLFDPADVREWIEANREPAA